MTPQSFRALSPFAQSYLKAALWAGLSPREFRCAAQPFNDDVMATVALRVPMADAIQAQRIHDYTLNTFDAQDGHALGLLRAYKAAQGAKREIRQLAKELGHIDVVRRHSSIRIVDGWEAS
jgi:hypothetical protein